MIWDTNLRGNLRLWPQAAPNIAAMAAAVGQPYEEQALLKLFPKNSAQGKQPVDARAVRNTFEILAHAGFMYREPETNVLHLTDLGTSVLSFLGVIAGRRFANEANLHLLGRALAPALVRVIECRAILALMRTTNNSLTNEELNRSMGALNDLDDLSDVSRLVLEARQLEDPTKIGERVYEREKYATTSANDQRRAMNPQFLLAGGGGILITVDQTDGARRIPNWAVPLIDSALSQPPLLLLHASTTKSDVIRIAAAGLAPHDVREGK